MLANEAILWSQFNKCVEIWIFSEIINKKCFANSVTLFDCGGGLKWSNLSRSSTLDNSGLCLLTKFENWANSVTTRGIEFLVVKFSCNYYFNYKHRCLFCVVSIKIYNFFFVTLEHTTICITGDQFFWLRNISTPIKSTFVVETVIVQCCKIL